MGLLGKFLLQVEAISLFQELLPALDTGYSHELFLIMMPPWFLGTSVTKYFRFVKHKEIH